MAQLWIRKYSLTIQVNGRMIDVSELQFKFTTTASTVGTPYRTLQCRIYNPAPDTIRTIVNEGTVVSLAAGYEGQYGLIFSGDIVQVRRGREDAVTTYLDLSATDGDTIYNQSVVNTTLAAGSNALSRIGVLGKSGGFKVNQVLANTKDTETAARGRVYFGMARDHLRQTAASIGSTYVITDGQVQILAQNATLPGQVTEVSSKTGLIGMPQQILDGLQLKVLLNPNLYRGSAIHVTSDGIQQYQNDLSISGNAINPQLIPLAVDGYYQVLWVKHKGDTRGTSQDDWSTELVCSINGQITASGGQGQYIDHPLNH